jgi:hypothetical protein
VEGEAERFGTIQQQELIARGGGAEGGERTPAVVRVSNDVRSPTSFRSRDRDIKTIFLTFFISPKGILKSF